MVCGKLAKLLNTRSGNRGKKEEGRRKKDEGKGKNYLSRFYLPFFEVYFRFLIPGSNRYKAKFVLLLVYKSCSS
jgi:hypothetical protein